MARNKEGVEMRKRRDFPRFVAVAVMDDRAAWARRQLEMEVWSRERVGVGGYAKQGRMGNGGATLEFRFKSAEAAAEFQAQFGGRLGAERTQEPRRKPTRRSADAVGVPVESAGQRTLSVVDQERS